MQAILTFPRYHDDYLGRVINGCIKPFRAFCIHSSIPTVYKWGSTGLACNGAALQPRYFRTATLVWQRSEFRTFSLCLNNLRFNCCESWAGILWYFWSAETGDHLAKDAGLLDWNKRLWILYFATEVHFKEVLGKFASEMCAAWKFLILFPLSCLGWIRGGVNIYGSLLWRLVFSSTKLQHIRPTGPRQQDPPCVSHFLYRYRETSTVTS